MNNDDHDGGPPNGDDVPRPTSQSPRPLDRLGGMLERAAPLLRRVDEALEEQGGLQQARNAIVGRAQHLIGQADNAVARAIAVEGTVVEPGGGGDPLPDAAAGGAPGGHRKHSRGHTAASPSPRRAATHGEPSSTPHVGARHWDRTRIRRMALAATREAVRPVKHDSRRRTVRWVGISVVVALAATYVLRRHRVR